MKAKTLGVIRDIFKYMNNKNVDVMSKNRKFVIIILGIIVISIFRMYFYSINVFAENKQEKHVLIAIPYTQDYPGSSLYINGIKSTLEKNSEFKFNYSYEYADLASHTNDEAYLENIAHYLKGKYSNYQPDFIITAVNLNYFFEKYGQDIFPNVPIIIDFDKEDIPATPIPLNHVIISQLSAVDQNIQLILKTKPLTKKIYIVIGNSIDKPNLAKSILDVKNNYSDKVELVLLENISYEDMMATIKNAEDNSTILYFQWLSDPNGKRFIPVEVIKAICKEAKVPVYGGSIQYLDSGIIGGYVGSQEMVGQTAGEVVLDILNGKKPSDNPVIRAMSRAYTFDWRQLKKWGIDEDKLPKGSVILYREKSVWELYKGYIIGTFVLLIIQAIFIFVLLVNRRKRRRAEDKLVQANIYLKEMTEKLISIDKMKDEFLVNTSHELQTPLNGIINISEMLAEGKYGKVNKKQEDELKVVLSVSKRLSSMIKDIIDFEKIKRDELTLNIKAVNIKSASEVVVQVAKHLIESNSIEILMNFPEKLSPVLADENRILQILYNLIGNAIKFTEKGTIKLYAEENENFVKVSVEDTGTGISEEKQKNLFQAFIQAETDVFTKYGGSGLGLYISKQLLERMNGQIFLEWSKPEKGSCFSFLIPKTTGEAVNSKAIFKSSLEETCVTAKGDNKSIKNFKILAVDDELTNLRVLQAVLDNEEYEVITASNGIEAIEAIRKQKDIDIVLMDVMMQGMSGYEACRKIREEYSMYDLPVLILTVRDTPEDIAMGFDVGANDFITKPFVAKELRARVSNLLQMKKSVQEALKNEMAFLQSQIKPHFLYNAISTIMSFCYTDGERAGELLGYLSEYLQKSFTIDNKETTVTLENELELTKAYAEIEKARFGERLTVEYDIDDSLRKERILPLIIQPLVENSIRHGLMKRESGGIVKVMVKKENDGIKVSVEDNGIGIENVEDILKSQTSFKRRKSGVGISNIKKRLMKFYSTELHVFSKVNKGTKVYFILNLEK